MPATNRNPAHMTPEQIVGEIDYLRDGIDQSSRRIYELSRTLHDQMRREDRQRISRNLTARPGTPEAAASTRSNVFLTYATIWTRLAGMVQQGLQRARQADRVLRLLPDDVPAARPAQEEVVETAPEPQAEAQAEAQAVPATSPLEDFIALYGEEMMRDADGQRQPG